MIALQQSNYLVWHVQCMSRGCFRTTRTRTRTMYQDTRICFMPRLNVHVDKRW